jgi:heat shock protein HslJ
LVLATIASPEGFWFNPGGGGATAGTDSALPTDVVDGTWQWVGITTPVERVDIDAPDRYTIRFERDGHLTVRADCNRGTTSA